MAVAFSICISHVFKGILEKGANANPITTTMYSIGFVCSHTLYYATLARRCDILVEKNLRFWPYKKADAAEVRHSKRVHQATFMRKFRTRGRRVPGTSDTVAEKDEEEVRAWCERFIEFFPMGYRQYIVSDNIFERLHCTATLFAWMERRRSTFKTIIK